MDGFTVQYLTRPRLKAAVEESGGPTVAGFVFYTFRITEFRPELELNRIHGAMRLQWLSNTSHEIRCLRHSDGLCPPKAFEKSVSTEISKSERESSSTTPSTDSGVECEHYPLKTEVPSGKTHLESKTVSFEKASEIWTNIRAIRHEAVSAIQKAERKSKISAFSAHVLKRQNLEKFFGDHLTPAGP